MVAPDNRGAMRAPATPTLPAPAVVTGAFTIGTDR
jgi:hypothetical protein